MVFFCYVLHYNWEAIEKNVSSVRTRVSEVELKAINQTLEMQEMKIR